MISAGVVNDDAHGQGQLFAVASPLPGAESDDHTAADELFAKVYVHGKSRIKNNQSRLLRPSK
jgi:hypothetical protein